ncbi:MULTISPECIES: hypothetical protein [Halomonas]|uniref:hypothetical protein n=1 Tax=Halomonas TaxID=2745 RepID=UPI0018685C6F|nr:MULTISPECIES: hypothetical protein [Halomonas]
MRRISDFLSRKEWAGIGVIVAIIGIAVAIWLAPIPKVEPKIEEKPQTTAVQNSVANLSSLNSIVNAINASSQDNLDKIYEGLIALLAESNASNNLMSIVERWKEPLAAKILGDMVVISTIDQYKIDGFILFFGLDTESLISASYDFGVGIQAIKVFETKQSSPEYLVSVKYMTQSGTGLYGESVRIYALGNQIVTEALDKPYYEYIDGSWGAYKSDVKFEQNNKIIMDGVFPKLTTIGRVTYTKTDNQEMQVELPKEEYTWDSNRSIFKQVSGRQAANRKTMSGMYADYAEPNGDWYEVPRDSNETDFSPEQW